MHRHLIWLAGLLACDVSRPVRGLLDAGPDCPPLPSPLLVDTLCSSSVCQVHAEGTCHAELSLDDCTPELPNLELERDVEGVVTAAYLGDVRCDVTEAAGPIRLVCPEPRPCEIRLVTPAAPRLRVVSTTTIAPNAQYRLPTGQDREPMDGVAFGVGWLSGATLMGPELLVLHHDFAYTPCQNTPTFVSRVDLESGLVTRTASTAPCLTSLLATDTGIYGAIEGRTRAVVRLDDSGSVSERVDMPAGVSGRLASTGLMKDSSGRIWALWTSGYDSELGVFETSPLRLATSKPFRAALRGLAETLDGIAVSDRVDGAISILEPTALTTRYRVPLLVLGTDRTSDDVGPILTRGSSVFAATSGQRAAVFNVQLEQRRSDRAQPFAHDGVPWGMASADDGTLWVGIFGYDETAVISAVSSTSGRFEPWALPIGKGAVRQILTHSTGLWAVLPWQGTVVHLTAN